MLSMVESWALVAHLVNEMRANEGWAGETHIQKSLFFLQSLLDVPLPYRFMMYKHGPYSFDFHNELGRMRANRILEIEPHPPYGPSFGLGPLGDNSIGQGQKVIRKYRDEIKFIVEVLSNKDVRTLERYSTALFVNVQNPGSDTDTIKKEVMALKPHISEVNAIDAINSIESITEKAKRLGLIK